MIVVGITGGIAAGKTTITKFLKSKGYFVHDSDEVVRGVYSKPKKSFLRFLKKIGLGKSIKNKKIDKRLIREEVFLNSKTKKKLEEYLHKEVKKSRDVFLKQNKEKKIVFMDIPLLFECGLDKMCDYVILMYSTKTIRRERALKRPGMDKAMFSKIVKNQIGDSFKKRKSNFVINSNTSKRKTFAQTIQAIQKIEKNNA